MGRNTRRRNAARLILPVALAIALVIFYYLKNIGPDHRRSPEKENGPSQEQADRVSAILQNMSLEDKVGQVIIAYFSGTEFTARLAQELQEIPLGGVILYSVAGNIESPAQVAALTGKIQKTAAENGLLPLFIAIDQEGGSVARLTEGITVFPGNMALGAADSPELARAGAAVIGRELRTLGVNWNFAPVVDVNNNPDNPVIGIRSFGSDPEKVARLGAATVDPYLAAGVMPTAKHFPGHGDTAVDSHYGLPLIPYDLDRLQNLELKPFQAMIEAGVPAVMMAHILVPELTGDDRLPASLSAGAVRYLREEMGFEGLVVTDSMGMGAITENWGLGEAAVMAFKAGVDIILFGPWINVQPGDRQEIFQALMAAVEKGEITGERLDRAVKRILSAKMKYKISDDPLPRFADLPDLASAHNREVARHIARESITLVRDRGGLIPLSTREMIPLIWPAELESSLAPLMEECPILQPYLLSLEASSAESEGLYERLRSSPLVIAGTYNLREHPAWAVLINNLNEQGAVAVLSLASPYDLLAVPGTGTYLCAYSNSSDSLQALGQVLNGSLTPKGRLPVEIPGARQEVR